MVFYALGSGAKGVLYFADYDNPPAGLGRDKDLWDEIGRINTDIMALAPYLAIGCPAGPAVETDKFWYRSVMCGRDKMALIVVNKGHHIGYNTQQGFAWNFPAKDVSVSAPLPTHFKSCRVEELIAGKLVPAQAEFMRGKMKMKLDEVDTARAFLISAD